MTFTERRKKMIMKSNELKRKESDERKRQWNLLSLEEKLEELNRRPGKSMKERKRIEEDLRRRNPK